ncbi:hypothetical protein ACSXC5_17675 (plasmid) [Clostridium perfringens]|uniref:Uncharacterized protein n=1 Tax=Clostridium perfringens TaxID=1502 RepID=A0A0N7BVH4_CLOPF|nr:hypothetical protein [Clostridium perfringens]AKF16676.1 hypothetical protein [Clostridium perfringens]ALD82543.1 hypothetical protein JFP838_pB0009 [Clostridium perfringens]
MKIKGKVLGALLISGISLASISNITYASSYVHQNGKVYVTNWSNYNYTHGYEGGVILEDERGNKPIFSQNEKNEWVSTVLTVKGQGDFGFSFNSDRVKVYDFESREEITNGLIKGNQKIYIVSQDDPTNVTLDIAPLIRIDN